jgi:uncharacterized membrane protein HdeD (DUF308 family)
MTTNPSTDNQKIRKNSVGIAVLLIVLGIIAIVLPAFSTLVAESWIALILISAGAAKLFYAVQTRDDKGFLWKILLSILYVATGVMLFVNPLTGILTLTLLLGSFLLTEGLFELVLAFQLRPQQNWVWVLGNAIVTLGLGALVWLQWPSDAPWLIGTVIGASVLFTGVSRLMLSLNPPSTSSSPDQVTSAS